MPGIFAQCTLIAASADSADNQVNGFAAELSGNLVFANLDTWTTAIKKFYDDTIAIGGLRGTAQNNHIVKFYDIAGAAPNYPLYEKTFNLGSAPNAVDMPQEVALAVSYRNNSLNTVFRARRRGRIYVSGWSESANTTGRPIQTVYEGLANAYELLANTVNGITNYEAGVWSRRDGVVYPIEEVWCDNEWDTQRRRGSRPTTRYSQILA